MIRKWIINDPVNCFDFIYNDHAPESTRYYKRTYIIPDPNHFINIGITDLIGIDDLDIDYIGITASSSFYLQISNQYIAALLTPKLLTYFKAQYRS
ncbi:hypothetical protein RCL_jg4972.t1 [Rhizophagus clarus]|uniref:Uncharacterized protein n=1 Tax=Rhizophagus clarus TaxID=94130 RepID=A0A8H3L8S2_9GLOM|nr:hypothetical protein RCL_jg4972.t1 [Rhizophagus clarus]